MTTDDVLDSPALPLLLALESAGVRVRLEGNRVLVSPPGVLTPEQRQVFEQYQDAVRVIVRIVRDEGVQARRDVFRHQFDATPAPHMPALLFRPGITYRQGACFS